MLTRTIKLICFIVTRNFSAIYLDVVLFSSFIVPISYSSIYLFQKSQIYETDKFILSFSILLNCDGIEE
jgi:hypothetical protein